MVALYLFACFKVGNGACHLQYTVICACRQVEPLHSHLEHREALLIYSRKFLYEFRRHLSITVNPLLFLIALLLYLTGCNYPFTNSSAGFALTRIGYLFEGYGNYLYLQVNTVEQRATYLVKVALNLSGIAHTRLCRMVIITARAGIHRCHEHHSCRILHLIIGARHTYLTVLQRLTHHLEHITREFGQLVKEEHSVMCK